MSKKNSIVLMLILSVLACSHNKTKTAEAIKCDEFKTKIYGTWNAEYIFLHGKGHNDIICYNPNDLIIIIAKNDLLYTLAKGKPEKVQPLIIGYNHNQFKIKLDGGWFDIFFRDDFLGIDQLGSCASGKYFLREKD